MRDTFFENSMNQLGKKAWQSFKNIVEYFLGNKEVRSQGYCAKIVGEREKPGQQHEFEAALLGSRLRLLSTESR
jgi:hypothetical protein